LAIAAAGGIPVCIQPNHAWIFVERAQAFMTMTYHKTAAGQLALQNRTLALTPRQRSAFILFDGKRSVEEVLRTTAGLGVTQADIDYLDGTGLLQAGEKRGDDFSMSRPHGQDFSEDSQFEATQAVGLESLEMTSTAKPEPASPHDEQVVYLKAYAIAKRLAAGSGLSGSRLNSALEAAGSLQELRELAPKIAVAVGPLKYRELQNALR
jgi:hypothetical protein